MQGMKFLNNLSHNIRLLMRRPPDVQSWGDSRSLPFTEGQAVVSPGAIAPAATRNSIT